MSLVVYPQAALKLPPGRYEVKATLRDAGGHSRANVRQQINIIASGSDPGR